MLNRQNHRQIQTITDNKATTLDCIKANSNTRPYKAKTTELSQPQGKAAKSGHTKPNIRDKTGKPAEHRAKQQNQYTQSQKAITIKTESDQRIKKQRL